MLQIDPDKRMELLELMEHPYTHHESGAFAQMVHESVIKAQPVVEEEKDKDE